MNIPGFWDYSQIRVKNKKHGRYSCGITVFAKDEIRDEIKVSEGFIWLKMSKTFFNFSNDIFLCASYIPPKQSTSHSNINYDYFNELSNSIFRFIYKGNICLLGD